MNFFKPSAKIKVSAFVNKRNGQVTLTLPRKNRSVKKFLKEGVPDKIKISLWSKN